MSLVSKILVGLVALTHVYFCYLEMFAWETRGPEVFTFMAPELFAPTKVLAANQGLYNLFLAGGLIWALLVQSTQWQRHIATYFLLCVLVAGLCGALAFTVTLYVQAIPAAIALASVLIWRKA
ncbi:DUF1304 domain-containing protein [uncultured Tateyamaria sp.]|uniref:DUF1304 domain-containing protein n=1 Tax=uncultured Tateyamaria sp. TaxID=455651 RepID=UPI0026182112|nr:DUF1304 domain-containing protein [uncultured Tateyamaria sp.]